jgi:peptidoglycan glycosyltransferase
VTNYGDPPKSFGDINMDAALTFSVNTYFAQLALAMDEIAWGALVDYAHGFGLSDLIPLDYPAVAISSIPDRGSMDDVELAWTGAGQGRLLLTPLQLAVIGSGIANRGKIMTPHMMKEIRREEEILERFNSEIWREPISSDTADQVLEMMINVVSSGTGTAAAIPGITVAGKTGTAEVEDKPNHTWFLGIAPAENPQVVVAVVVENSGGGGGSVAAPIAKEVMEAALQ